MTAPENFLARWSRKKLDAAEEPAPPTADTAGAPPSTKGGREREPLPLADRLHADHGLTGRGVVAAFIDSGFFAHPDLITPHSRIHGYQDIIGGSSDSDVTARIHSGSRSSPSILSSSRSSRVSVGPFDESTCARGPG